MIRLERNGERIIRWIIHGRSENTISIQEPRTRLESNSTWECLQATRLQWLGYLERMKENGWSSKCRIIENSGSFSRVQPRRTWNDIIRKDLKDGSQSRVCSRQKSLEASMTN